MPMYFLPPASLHDVEDLVAPCRLGAKSGSVSDFTPKTKVGSQGVFFLVSKKTGVFLFYLFLGCLSSKDFFRCFTFSFLWKGMCAFCINPMAQYHLF